MTLNMGTDLSFTVLGRPQPAGSKTAFTRRGGGVTVTDANRNAASWKYQVATAALDAEGVGMRAWEDLLEGPLSLYVEFVLARPLSHYGTGRNAGRLRPGAPVFPAVRPDATKLLRAVEDALTGVVWRDDAQIVHQIVWKVYGLPERCEIHVNAIPNNRRPLTVAA